MSGAEASITFATIDELGARLRRREISAVELARQALDRLDTIGRSLNAVAILTPERALAEAGQADAELAAGHDRGPLHGIPYGLKDLVATAGIPTSWGVGSLRDQVFDRDAAVAERLRDRGAVLVAKLATGELAGGFSTDERYAAMTGPGINPWDRERWAGGSSNGPASAVAAGCVPFAIGSECFGSITWPAGFCGISGLRPTFGRVSRRGTMALVWTMDKIGPMTRSAGDCAVVFEAIAGEDPEDPSSCPVPAWARSSRRHDDRFRIAVLRDGARDAQPAVAASFAASLEVLSTFADLEEIALPDYPFNEIGMQMLHVEGAAAFEEFMLSDAATGLAQPIDRYNLAHALTVPAVDYLRALRVRRLASRALDETLTGFDAIVAPTTRDVAAPITGSFEWTFGVRRGPSLVGPGNVCGLPSISIPNGFDEQGLPTALEIAGRAFADETVLAIAEACQARTGWHRRHPAV
jgi:aspartyl-tRNA(Asn)/glutamyl-tRNA(Gln) amidotransferase subunit A